LARGRLKWGGDIGGEGGRGRREGEMCLFKQVEQEPISNQLPYLWLQ